MSRENAKVRKSKVREELEKALEDLQTLLDLRLDTQGGYPADMSVIADKYIVIADVDHDGGPELTILDLQKFMRLWRQACADCERSDEDDISSSLFEAGYPGACQALDT